MEKKMSRQERERLQLIQTVTGHAEELFRQNGYENTTLDALAMHSEYTKRTIYRYFVSKEDLYFAVMFKGHNQLLEVVQAGIKNGRTGNEKIAMAYKASFNFFNDNGWLFDLVAQLQAIKQKRDPGELPYYEKYTGCLDLLHKEIIALFVMAHDDKSIRTDIDPQRLGYSSALIMNGLFHMLRLYGDRFPQRLDMDAERFAGFTAQFLFQALGGQ